VNHALPIEYPDDYGTRTDVLYHILSRLGVNRSKKLTVGPEEIELWKNNIKWLVCRHHSISQRALKMGPVIDSAFPWICMDYSFYKELKRTIGEKAPNTGMAAIMHILLSKVRSLTVVGFDFYRSGVYPGYGDVKKEEDARVVNDRWHSTEAQIEYFKKVVARDNRIIIDSHLKEILADEETS
jgi:hypothetical protein